MAIAKTFLENKTSNKIFIRSILKTSASLGILLNSSKAIAETPIVFTDSTILSVSFAECKSRATTAANYLLRQVQISEERNLRFKITGNREGTVAVIYCIERSQGTIAIVTTSTYGDKRTSKASFIYNKLTDMITSK